MEPSVKESETCPLLGVAVKLVGGEGKPATAFITELDKPEPYELTALILIGYDVPFVNPVIIIGEEVIDGLEVIQVEPLSILNS